MIIAAASPLDPPAPAIYLTLRNKDSGELYARYRMDEGERFSITFKHSVNQYPLTDTFEVCDGRLYAEECKYYAYGAGVQVELNPGEELSYTEDGAHAHHRDPSGSNRGVLCRRHRLRLLSVGERTEMTSVCVICVEEMHW